MPQVGSEQGRDNLPLPLWGREIVSDQWNGKRGWEKEPKILKGINKLSRKNVNFQIM